MTLQEEINIKEKQYKDSVLFRKLFVYVKKDLFKFILSILLDTVAVIVFAFEPRITVMIVGLATDGQFNDSMLF